MRWGLSNVLYCIGSLAFLLGTLNNMRGK